MSRFFAEMNSSSADSFGGCFAAYMASLLLVFTGIAVAVSVVFFAEGALAVRLCFVIVLAILVLRTVIPVPAEAPMR